MNLDIPSAAAIMEVPSYIPLSRMVFSASNLGRCWKLSHYLVTLSQCWIVHRSSGLRRQLFADGRSRIGNLFDRPL